MDGKIVVFLIGIINYSSCAGLLRTPKVYNAVITTDENLTPSRAFPVIQPTFHETGIATFPFGPYTPYHRFYNPPIVQLSQPGIPHGLFRPEQLPGPFPLERAEGFPSGPGSEPMMPEMQMRENPLPRAPPKPDQIPMMPEEKAPIPVNEFGLPPSLVPLQSYPQRPVSLQPYPYNHYPLVYDSYNQFQDHLLPPYGYFPSHTFGIRPPSLHKPEKPHPPSASAEPGSEPQSPEESKRMPDAESSSNFIKNGIDNKNSDIPDVPPPPLPSGAKSSE